MTNEKPKPYSLKWWIALIIAILSAIGSFLGTTATAALQM